MGERDGEWRDHDRGSHVDCGDKHGDCRNHDGDDDGHCGKLVQLPPGKTAPPVVIHQAAAGRLIATAFAAAARGPGAPAPGSGPVVWADGEHELLVHPERARALFADGFVLIGVTVFTEQTGAVEISVPFAVGRRDAPTGLMAATEPVPRGPALITERWGEQLIAAAWQALIRVAGDAATGAGTDLSGQPLIPVALIAGDAGLTVLPQATPAVSATANGAAAAGTAASGDGTAPS